MMTAAAKRMDATGIGFAGIDGVKCRLLFCDCWQTAVPFLSVPIFNFAPHQMAYS